MGFGDLLKKGAQSLGSELKRSYQSGELGDNMFKALIETAERKGDYAAAEELRAKLRERRNNR